MSEGLPVEIERTHLVSCIPNNLDSGQHLRQWYIPISSIEIDSNISIGDLELVPHISDEWLEGVHEVLDQDDPTIRIRLNDECAILCIKGPTIGISRIEFEWEIKPYTILKELLESSDWPLVEKIRWDIQSEDGHIWNLDRFLGLNEGLWLAEIELRNEDTTYHCPKWVGIEVSDDPRFTSKRLAEWPFSVMINPPHLPESKCYDLV